MATISRNDLHQFARDHIRWVSTVIAKSLPQTWYPQLMVMVEDSSGVRSIELQTILGAFNGQPEKHQTLQSIGAAFARQRKCVIAVAFSCEAWLSKDPQPGQEPKDGPLRQEILLVGVVSCQREACVAQGAFQRAEGKIASVEFGELKTEGVTFPLLHQFFIGYLRAATMRPRGIPAFSAN